MDNQSVISRDAENSEKTSDPDSQRSVKRTRRSKRKKPEAMKNPDESIPIERIDQNHVNKLGSLVNGKINPEKPPMKNKFQKSKKEASSSGPNNVEKSQTNQSKRSTTKVKNDPKAMKRSNQFLKNHFESVNLIVNELDKLNIDLKNLSSHKTKLEKKNLFAKLEVKEKSKKIAIKKRKLVENEGNNPAVNDSNAKHPNQLQKANKSKKGSKNDAKEENKSKPNKRRAMTFKFPNYYTDEEVESGLKNKILIEGVIRINVRNYKECYVSNPNKGERDFKIEGFRNRNRAMEGDVVIIKLNKKQASENSKQLQTATVVQIKTMVHPRICIGHLKLQEDDKKFACFVPRDFRIPRILIPVTDWPPMFVENAKLYERTLFLARICEWSSTTYAIGTILEMLGQSGDLQVEAAAILKENSLDVTPFEAEMRQYYPKTGDIPDEEFKYRQDLRKECIFTVDPPTARDLDDALSIKRLGGDRFEVGVHISDVSYFLKENTPLNDKVAEKAVTVYLVDAVYTMLPYELTNLCSLTPGQDKMAFSVFWEINSKGKVFNHRITRTIINSCSQLSYHHVQAIIENKENIEKFPNIFGEHSFSSIQEKVKDLYKISSNLRNSRFENGALKINQPKIEFQLNPKTYIPESYNAYISQESHQLIEEFMLLANITVATKLRDDFPKLAFLRCHPPPLQHLIGDVQKTFEKVGIHLDISSAGSLYKSIVKYSGDDPMSTARMLVINAICAKPMARAKYFCAATASTKEDFWHYALNIPLYTHFTSPIRRYADVMVHRLLAASLNYAPKPVWSIDNVACIAANCNKQNFNAKKASEQSSELYFCKYVAQKGSLVEDAVVLEVRDSAFLITLVSVGINIRIYKNNLGPVKIIKEIKDMEINSTHLEWPADESKNLPSMQQIIEIFTVVKVVLTYPSSSKKLIAQLLRPNIE